MPTHQGKGVTMIYINRYKRGFRRFRPNFAFFGLLGLFMLFICTPGHSGVIALPQTGQTVCYDSLGDIIPCLGTGQDGDILAGVAWPDPRFEIFNFACIIDNLTGLMWAKDSTSLVLPNGWDAAVIGPVSFQNLCGFADWRLPNINELQSLVNADQPNNALWLLSQGFLFPLLGNLIYWSSTTWAEAPSDAWIIDIVDGSIWLSAKNTVYYVWPVRQHQFPIAAP